MKLEKYLENNYKPGEPIFLSDIKIDNLSNAAIKQELSNLVKKKTLKKYDRGIYYINVPQKTVFGFEIDSVPSFEVILEKKYLCDEINRFGYISGQNFINNIGLTTQCPRSYTIRTNKIKNNSENRKIGKVNVFLKKARTEINSDNYRVLALLDMFAEYDAVEEEFYDEVIQKVKKYCEKYKITNKDIIYYLDYYPLITYKNMVKANLMKVNL